jgi:hypothetical protein
MKAVRSVVGMAVNPLFSKEAQRQAKAKGQKYETGEFIECPIGQELDDPDAWRLCVLGKAYPADEECSKKVLEYMSDERRQQTVNDIKLLREAAKSNQLSKKDRRMLEMMEKAYAVELGLSPSPIAAVIETDPPTPVVESRDLSAAAAVVLDDSDGADHPETLSDSVES